MHTKPVTPGAASAAAERSPAAAAGKQRRAPRQGFELALELMQEPAYDFDLVHKLLTEAVLGDPGNALRVDAFLRNASHQHGEDPRGARSAPTAIRDALQGHLEQKHWNEVLRLGLEVLRHNPWERPALLALADACATCGWAAAELRYLQNARATRQDDNGLNRRFAHVAAALGRFDEALAAWHQVEAADPHDAEAPRMIAQLSMDKARQAAKALAEGAEEEPPAEPAGTPAAPPVEGGAPARRRSEAKPLKLTRRQELEQMLIACPGDEDSALELVELHLAENRSYDAQRTLVKALEFSNNLRIIERLEDVHILRASDRLRVAEQRATAEPTPASVELLEKARRERHELEFEIFRRRCERYPQNKALQFQLGVRLKQLGNYKQALEPLQAGLEVPQHRAMASLEIGEILHRYRQFPKALQCYRQAAQLAHGAPELAECRMRALYRAATLAESMKLLDSAQQYWQDLVKIAPDYKDARSRLDKLAEIGEDLAP